MNTIIRSSNRLIDQSHVQYVQHTVAMLYHSISAKLELVLPKRTELTIRDLCCMHSFGLQFIVVDSHCI